jgi:tRNA(Ile)-lysidine synthase
MLPLLRNLASLPSRYPVTEDYLVGCSGGRDSVVLLDVLSRLRYRRLIVCHLNHRLRGEAAAGDAAFVSELARNYEFDFEIGESDVRALSEERKISVETAGRQARREFFQSIATRCDCPRIFLAHHADDQVETVLMNFLRGAGSRGLAGMLECSESESGLELIRPLLGCWREELDDYARAQKLVWRDDVSNASLDPLRNRIRHELLPLLGQICRRDVRSVIWRNAVVAEGEDALLTDLAAEAWAGVIDGSALSTAKLRALPAAIQRRIVQRWLQQAGIPGVGFGEIAAIIELIEPTATTSKLNLPDGWRARRRAGLLFLDRQKM